MICSVCGKTTTAEAGRCASCGAPLAVSAEPPTGIGATTAGYLDTHLGDSSVITASPTAASKYTMLPGVAGPDTTGLPPSAGGIRHTVPAEGGPLAVGKAFGPRYHIIRLLGIGGMGAVYEAWDAELSVAVALKVIRPMVTADPSAAAELERRFKNELLLARQVTHKNVVRIHDLGRPADARRGTHHPPR